MKSFSEAFLEKYPQREYVLNRIYEYDAEPEWSKFTKPYLSALVRYFRGVMSDSSAKTALAYVKAVLNENSEVVELPTRKFNEVLTIRSIKSTATWLTEDELKQLRASSDVERLVLADFLIGAYTGARYSDFVDFDERNIVGNRLDYTSKKTGIRATVPLKPVVRKLLKMERSNVSTKYFNTTIKEICRKSGITEEIKLFKAGETVCGEKWKFVSSHTARRSFATNLYLRGVDIVSIGKMMGHSSVEMTERYIVCGLRDLSEEAMNFFK